MLDVVNARPLHPCSQHRRSSDGDEHDDGWLRLRAAAGFVVVVAAAVVLSAFSCGPLSDERLPNPRSSAGGVACVRRCRRTGTSGGCVWARNMGSRFHSIASWLSRGAPNGWYNNRSSLVGEMGVENVSSNCNESAAETQQFVSGRPRLEIIRITSMISAIDSGPAWQV